MKITSFTLFVLMTAAFLNCKAQYSELEFQLLVSAHDSMIGKFLHHKFPIIYTSTTSPPNESLEKKIFNIDSIGALNGIQIILTETERKEIISQFNHNFSYSWAKNLFPNSKVIKRDSLYPILNKSRGEAWRKEARTLKLRPSAFVFSKPCFIRNGTIAFIGFADICSGECGVIEVGYYGLENKKWVKLKEISGGIF